MAFPLNKQKIKSVYHKLSQVTPEAESKHNRKYFEREGHQQLNIVSKLRVEIINTPCHEVVFLVCI